MRYRQLGRSGLIVSELCLGSNTFGGGSDPMWKRLGGLEQAAANAVIARAIEGGINFIDTADGYANGESEMTIGRALKDLQLDRSSLVLCTKAGMRMGQGPNASGSSRKHLIEACEGSLKRLGTDYIDVYMLHFLDPVTPLDETLRALDDLVRSGKIRYIGCSNFSAWEVMKGLSLSERAGWARFEVVEAQWSIATRELERQMVPMALSEGVGIMAWGPLLGGVLTGKYGRDGASAEGGRAGGKIPPMLDANAVHDIIDAMREIGRAHEVTPAEIALAFLLGKPALSSVIFGATRPEQVASNLKAAALKLSDEEMQRLETVSALKPIFGESTVANARRLRLQYL